MTHTVIHIGDAHFGPRGGRNEDRYAALEQIIAYGEELASRGVLAAWVWPGDLGDAKLPIEDINAIDRKLMRMAERAPVLVCYGNHDVRGDLDSFGRLTGRYPIYVFDHPVVFDFMTATGIVMEVFIFPYPHKAGLVSGGAAVADVSQEAHALLDPIFMNADNDLAVARAGGRATFMIGHVNVAGSKASTGQPQIGQEIELSAQALARLGSIYKGLNHIHKHQTIHGAVYAGSFCRLDFGENEPKGFIEIEFQQDGTEWEHRWGFRELNVPRQVSIEGVLTPDGFTVIRVDGQDIIEAIAQGSFQRHWLDDADVRVTYEYAKTDAGAIDQDDIRAWVGKSRSLKLEPVPILEHSVRAPEVVAAKTLDEKVRAFCALNKIEWTPGLANKLTALQAKPAEALLAELATALAPQKNVRGEAFTDKDLIDAGQDWGS